MTKFWYDNSTLGRKICKVLMRFLVATGYKLLLLILTTCVGKQGHRNVRLLEGPSIMDLKNIGGGGGRGGPVLDFEKNWRRGLVNR